MPTFTFGPPLGIQPNIINSGGDDLERQLRLAQIKNLQGESDYRNKALAQTGQYQTGELASRAADLAETSKFHEGTLGVETDKNAIARQGLSQSLQESKDKYNTELTGKLLDTMPYYGMKKDEMAEVLRRSGHPEVADTFAALHEKDLDSQAQKAQTAIASGVLKPEEISPEIRSRIKATVPGNLQTPTPNPTTVPVVTAPPPPTNPYSWDPSRKMTSPNYNKPTSIMGRDLGYAF